MKIFIKMILYFAFPNHYLCCKHQENDYKCQKDCFIAYYVSFYLLFKMIFEILDFVNDSKIFPIYDNIIYNWKINPIRNIQLSSYYEDSESFIRWKDYILKIERLRDFNYINIYSSSNTKLCGKDNLGNNLYFPENIDCPINDIFITSNEVNFPDYTKVELDNNNFLYYTNQATNGKLLIDFRINSELEIPLNPDGDSESNYYSIPFYEEIDSAYSTYLYAINYLGINSSSVSKSKLENFEKKIDDYKKIFIAKIVFFCV